MAWNPQQLASGLELISNEQLKRTVWGHDNMLGKQQISHVNLPSALTKHGPPWVHTPTHASHRSQRVPNHVPLVFAGAPLHQHPVLCAGHTRDLRPVPEVPDVRQQRHVRLRRLQLEPCEHRAIVRSGRIQPPLIPGGPRTWASTRTLIYILIQCHEVQAGVRAVAACIHLVWCDLQSGTYLTTPLEHSTATGG